MPGSKRYKVPQLIQMQAGESGAVCLSMILAAFESYPSREKIATLCGVTGSGVPIEQLLHAAKVLGMNTTPHQRLSDVGIDDLPCIVPMAENKYMLLVDISGSSCELHDPSAGKIRLNRSELERRCTGPVIACTPTTTFAKEGKPTGFFQQVETRLAMNKSLLIFVLICGLLLIIPGIIIPALNKLFFDDIVLQNQSNWFKPMLSLMATLLVFGGIVTYFQSRKILLMEVRMSLVESARFFQHVFRLPISFFTNRHPGEVFKRIQLNDDIATLLSRNLTTSAISLVSVLIYAIVMLKYSLVLTLIGVGTSLANLIALRFISAKRTALNQVLFENSQKTFSTAGVGIEQIETIKATGTENDFYELWSGYLTGTVNTEQNLGVSSRILDVLPDFLSQLNNVIILLMGGVLIMKGDITVGLFIALQSLMANMTAPIKNMVNIGGQIQLSKSNLETIRDAMDTPVDPLYREKEGTLDGVQAADVNLNGLVEVKNITFGYDRFSEPLIEDFSLTIHPGKRVALVGGSGSGKSTMAKIISGIYQPWNGQICFDGRDRNELHPDVLRNSFSMVDQDIFLFMGTVGDNITMWNRSINRDEVIRAAKDACIHDIISARPEGYEGKVAPGGGNFSGGQRQRIEIARALVTSPAILVLDEATSALDTDTERIIDHNIRKRGCTTLIIAHRLSTVKDCDEIIVMDRGKVVQRGTHEEMSTQVGTLYYELIKNA